MTEKQLQTRADKIIEVRADDEIAHSEEDKLYLDVIKEFCPAWVIREIDRLKVIGMTAEECKCCTARNKALTNLITTLTSKG